MNTPWRCSLYPAVPTGEVSEEGRTSLDRSRSISLDDECCGCPSDQRIGRNQRGDTKGIFFDHAYDLIFI